MLFRSAPVAQPADMRFALFGKQNSGGNDSMEPYSVTVRFIDENGMVLGASPVVSYAVKTTSSGAFLEWFDHLEGISGIGGRIDANIVVPPGAKTIEFRAVSDTGNTERHLVGYIGYVNLSLPEFARQYGQ